MVKILIMKDRSMIGGWNWLNHPGVPFKPVKGGWTMELDHAALLLGLELLFSRNLLPNKQIFPYHDPNCQLHMRLGHLVGYHQVLGNLERVPYVQGLDVDHEQVEGHQVVRQEVEGHWMEGPLTHYPPSDLLWFQEGSFWVVDPREFINPELGLRLLPGRIRQCQLPYIYPQMIWYNTGRLYPVDPLVIVNPPREWGRMAEDHDEDDDDDDKDDDEEGDDEDEEDVIEYPLARRPVKRVRKRSRDVICLSESESEDGGFQFHTSKHQRKSEDSDSEEEQSPGSRPGTSGVSRKRSRDDDDDEVDNIHTKRQCPLW